MATTIDVQERAGYLRFHVQGVESLHFSVDCFKAVAGESRQRGFTNILIVEQVQGQLSVMDMFSLGKKLPEILRGLKVAYVDLDPGHDLENQFGENVALFLGICG